MNINDKFEFLSAPIYGKKSIFYKAQDKESKRIVGLKLIRDREQCNREGFILQELKGCLNIVRLYDYGTIYNQHYISMEYLGGHSLNHCIKVTDIRSDWILSIIRVINYVHYKGYSHGDISSLHFLSAFGNIKLIDFGEAKPLTIEGLRYDTYRLGQLMLDLV